ncbi:MAG: lipid kinase [Halomonadaceae bacterium]|nr:MAG: lipid kinase [Halomonadaceae bacterium]
MIRFKASVLTLLLSALLLLPTSALARDSFSVCWSIYAGWMPWAYGDESGIVDKWAEKYGIEIDVVQINDYIESINQYTAGRYDGCTMTNMDALTIPAAGGVDSTALIVGDFSDGNDGLVLKGKDRLEDVKGQRINLVELSVSHYMLARALDSVGLTERDVTVVNTGDADIVAAFSSRNTTAVAAWNPQLSTIMAEPSANLVFDSTQIPGEIIDMMVVNTKTLEENPNFGKALTGAWYEIMATMRGDSDPAKSARQLMGEAAGTDREGYEKQLEATHMFYQPASAVEFVMSPALKDTMQLVAEFSFEHGLLGDTAPGPDIIGIETPSGVYGNSDNIRLRFSPEYMQQAAAGEQ